MTKPETKSIRAIDVISYRWGIWCSIEDGKPFTNVIEHMKWSDDGRHIWFMLGTHNFHKAEPYEMLDLVPCEPDMSSKFMDEVEKKHEKFVKSRPQPTQKCFHCKGTGHTHYWPKP